MRPVEPLKTDRQTDRHAHTHTDTQTAVTNILYEKSFRLSQSNKHQKPRKVPIPALAHRASIGTNTVHTYIHVYIHTYMHACILSNIQMYLISFCVCFSCELDGIHVYGKIIAIKQGTHMAK